MFVGQLPRSFTDDDVRKLFQEFGPIYQINMLRDKASGQSKGCCFITFYQRKSALDAQNALHNIRTLPGMHNPIQMKPADTENRSERKLFVGMISKKATEEDIRKMFAAFGFVEECTILRDGNGSSRGCAFVTFASRQNALNAIRVLHHSQTAEGCTSPVVVKMADTTKDKDTKRQPGLSPVNVYGNPAFNSLSQQYLSLWEKVQQAGALNLSGLLGTNIPAGLAGLQQFSPLTANAAINSGLLSNFGANGININAANELCHPSSALSSLAAQLSNNSIYGGANNASVGGYNGASVGNSTALQNHLSNLSALVAANDNSALMDRATGTSSSKGPDMHAFTRLYPQQRTVTGTSSAMGTPITTLGYGNGSSSLSGSFPNGMATNPYDQMAGAYSQLGLAKVLSNSVPTTVSRQTEGPEGCNLFIYHLPPEYGDTQLVQLFSSFGTVISAKVFVDKQTALSKCFGFVSFDNQVSAQAAISSMNGFQIGLKRLKVQLKRGKDKPY